MAKKNNKNMDQGKKGGERNKGGQGDKDGQNQ